MSRRTHTQAATSIALAWTFYEADGFDVPRIDVDFDAAPTSAGLLTVKKDSGQGAAYDTIIRSTNPVGKTSVHFEGLYGFVDGDKILVEYANPDTVSITGTASVELINSPWDLDGMTADSGLISSKTAQYRRYYHIPLLSARIGAVGPTFVPSDANQISGWQLDADTEILYFQADVHNDWDQVSDITVELTFTCNVDNTLGGASDEVDFQLVCTYAGQGDAVIKTQTLTPSNVVGACAQYTVFHQHFTINYDEASNVVDAGDVVSMALNVLATSDVTDITINDAAFFYNKYHVGTESGDV